MESRRFQPARVARLGSTVQLPKGLDVIDSGTVAGNTPVVMFWLLILSCWGWVELVY